MPLETWEAKLREASLPAHLVAHLVTMGQLQRENRYDRLTDSFRQLVGPRTDFRRRIRPPQHSHFHASSPALSGERIPLAAMEQHAARRPNAIHLRAISTSNFGDHDRSHETDLIPNCPALPYSWIRGPAGWIIGDLRFRVADELGADRRRNRRGRAQPDRIRDCGTQVASEWSRMRVVEGCLDIDLGFSPSTNLVPIRRLRREVGEEAIVAAAWLPFPSLRFEILQQLYRREGDRTWHYESGFGVKSSCDADEAWRKSGRKWPELAGF